MKKKILYVIPAIGFLAACGGGSTSISPTGSFTTLKAFSDSAGVGRGVMPDGTEMVFIAPDIATVVADGNKNNEIGLDSVNFSDFAIVETLATGVVRQGTITIDGIVSNVTIVQDNTGEAGLVYVVLPGVADAVLATGSAFGTAPNGNFTYNGVHLIGDRFTGEIESGDFTLTADFNNKTFGYNGSTVGSSLTGSGIIDTVNGRFSSSNLTSTVGVSGTASMYGQLHGSSADAISGVFHTNEADPIYGGAFVGNIEP